MWSFNHCTASQVHRDIKLENFLYEAKAWCVRFISLFFLPFLLGISGTSSWGLTLHCFALPLLNFSCRTLIIWSWLILVSATWLSPENMDVVDARATRVSPFHGVSGKIWHPNTTMAVSCGTLAYVAPEVLEKSYTSQCYLAVVFSSETLTGSKIITEFEVIYGALEWWHSCYFLVPWRDFCYRKCSRSCCGFRNELN